MHSPEGESFAPKGHDVGLEGYSQIPVEDNICPGLHEGTGLDVYSQIPVEDKICPGLQEGLGLEGYSHMPEEDKT